jgi:glycosyltransferase involved in cell wall biosynthesis
MKPEQKMRKTAMKNRQIGQPRKSISVFFPAFNDQGSIAVVVGKAFELLPLLTDDYEVIVVNDGSSDGTAAVLDDLQRRYTRLTVIHHERNRGYGGALQTGFANASKDLVFYTDGDGQYDVNELANLVPLMVDGVDVVNGFKIKRSDNMRRIVLGEIYKFLARHMFALPIRDVDCDFRLMRREAIQEIELKSHSGVVCAEMIYKLTRAGRKFTEVPVNHYPRLHDRSQFFTFSRVARTAFDFFALWLKLVVLRQRAPGVATGYRPLTKPGRGGLNILFWLIQSIPFIAVA